MSRPPEHENGMYAANAANQATGGYDVPDARPEPDVAQAPPTVYHPLPEESPAYDAYVDPAAAHGWQNAYDETTELPAVVDGAGGAHEVRGVGGTSGPDRGYDYVYEVGYDYGDYGDGHAAPRRRSHRGRHQPAAWRSHRVAIAAGALGVVSAAALIAGFSLSGSSTGGGTQTKHDRTSTTSNDSVVPQEPSAGASAGVRRSDDADPSRSASPSASPSPSASDDAESDDSRTEEPSTAPSTTSEAPPTPTATAAPTSDKPGRGQGNPKKPG
ncbi:hypothetical protein ACIBU0_09440 [Streptomyces sp. NPDC049627]|uniref:hypothetical protein n=1 Tax=Streptomyces sp. NPDC049627 TaxID=3365595 RepID=UPI00379B21DD